MRIGGCFGGVLGIRDVGHGGKEGGRLNSVRVTY